MTPDTFRRLALALPGAHESAHFNHPDFRVGKRVFATLGYPGPGDGMVKLTPLQQSQFVAAFPAVFAPVPGGWGVKGATRVNLRNATVGTLRPALHEAWRNLAPASAAPAPAAARRAPAPGSARRPTRTRHR
ncbi:MAG: MmcQ/YjbR family DNA-binding protein [Proteobacteria bacterium]|nr:MmcQ/YjbR family DNA-binding protein [Pseudomonadota bacterium]